MSLVGNILERTFALGWLGACKPVNKLSLKGAYDQNEPDYGEKTPGRSEGAGYKWLLACR